MDANILKQLFMELFEVSHLMLDLICKVEECEKNLIEEFFVEQIRSEYTRSDIEKHKQEKSYSCLGCITNEEYKAFVESLFNE